MAGVDCGDCPIGLKVFDSSKSSTYATAQDQTEINIAYGTGNVTGGLAQDTVSMGGLVLDSQAFIVASSVSPGMVNAGQNSGLLGLALAPESQANRTPFWQNLMSSGKLLQPEIGLWLEHGGGGPGAGGVLTLGGTNSSLYTGDIEFHDVVSSGTVSETSWWTIKLTSMSKSTCRFLLNITDSIVKISLSIRRPSI